MKRWMPWMRVVVLAAAAGGVWWRVDGDSCEYHRMSPQAVQLVVVVSALDVWRSDNGRYPQHLDALLTAGPAGLGPYRTAPDLLDVWGYPLVYRPDPPIPTAAGSGCPQLARMANRVGEEWRGISWWSVLTSNEHARACVAAASAHVGRWWRLSARR